jgi:hypothetical protein
MLTERLGRTGMCALAALAMVIIAGASIALPQVTQVDVSPGGVPTDAHSRHPVRSADGRYVAFVSLASNLVAGDAVQSYDFFRFDCLTGVMLRLDAPGLGRFGGPSQSVGGESCAETGHTNGLECIRRQVSTAGRR